MTETLAGKVAMVTGGASGMGAEIARTFAREGASVVVADRNLTAAESVASTIEGDGGVAVAFDLDVTDDARTSQVVDEAVRRYGRVDIAVNGAGVHGSQFGMSGKRLDEWTEEAFDAIQDINFIGVTRCMRHQIRQMLEQGSGSIINIASIGSFVGMRGSSAYVASKHAVVGLTRSAAVEYADKGIRINAICPGVISTPLGNAALGGQAENFINSLPFKRVGEVGEVAPLATFLASDIASYMTGGSYVVDGGYLSA